MRKEKIELPFDKSKEVDAKSALEVLRDFYLEARRELKKSAKVMANGRVTEDAASLRFVADGFDLELKFREGGAV